MQNRILWLPAVALLTAAALSILLNHAAHAATNSDPQLIIPTHYPGGSPGTVTVPIDFKGANSGVAGIAFSINVDSNCLALNSANAVDFHLPPQFRGSASYDPDDEMGELDIAIADYSPPLSTLPDLAPLLTVTFDVTCLPQEAETIIAPLLFSQQPPASFSNTLGRNLKGSVEDGSVAIVPATPTPEPSETPEPVETPTPPPANTAPIAEDDRAQTSEYRPVTVAVLNNDRDPDGDDLTLIEVTQGAFGTVTAHGDGSLTYLPAPGRNGVDLFSYTVSDGQGGLSMATVTVEVTDVNIPPVAVDDLLTTDEDTTLVMDLLANDYDPDGAEDDVVLSLAVHGQPSHGTLTPEDDRLAYTPAPNYYGEDRFSYAITDAEGGSAVGEVVITILSVNDPPQGAGIADQLLYAGESLSLQVDVYDADGPGSELHFTANGLPPGLTIDPASGEISGTVGRAAAGQYPVTVSVDDGEETTVFTATWLVSVPTAIRLVGITATAGADEIEITWTVEHDRGLTGFRLYRTTTAASEPNWVEIDSSFPVTEPGRNTYAVTDATVVPGITYRYLLALYDGDLLLEEHRTEAVRVGGDSERLFMPIVGR